MPRRAPRTDGNQDEIINALRGRGCKVRSLAGHAKGIPDLLCLWAGDVYLVEVKMPGGKLTDDQIEFAREGWPVRICRTVEDVGRFFPLVEAT